MIRNLFGGSKCRTIDVCDIFGDNSGKALYRLDGNANDESGNYHGTEVTGVTYGGGAYERGVIVTNGKIDLGAGSKVLMPSTSDYSISAWIYNSGTASRRMIATRTNASVGTGLSDSFYYESDNTLIFQKVYAGVGGSVESLIYTPSYSVGWHHVVVAFARGANIANIYSDGILVATKNNWNIGTYDNNLNTLIGAFHNANYNAYQDQLRFFNRAITATEVATLFAECAPTSIVDNINPFEDGSLKALYQFNGDATDKTGVYNGTATNVTYGTGKFGQCAVFNGTNAYSTLSNTLQTYIQPSSSWSITGFVKVSSFTNGGCIISFSSSNNLQINTETGSTLSFTIYNASYAKVTTGTLSTGIWYFVSAIYNNGTMLFYIDGKLIGTATKTLIASTSQPLIGALTTSLQLFNGSIDQLRIFNKALTPMEVASLYNETTPMEEPMHSLVDPFKDGSGKALYRLDGNVLDESGNYNGTNNGGFIYINSIFGRAISLNGSTQYMTSSPYLYDDFTLSIRANHNSSQSSTGFVRMPIFYRNFGICFYNGLWRAMLGYQNEFVTINSAIPTENSYLHLVLTKSGTSYSFYINGALVATQVGTYTLSSELFFIGKNGLNATYFQGSAYQARLFNRALIASEVSTLYTEV